MVDAIKHDPREREPPSADHLAITRMASSVPPCCLSRSALRWRRCRETRAGTDRQRSWYPRGARRLKPKRARVRLRNGHLPQDAVSAPPQDGAKPVAILAGGTLMDRFCRHRRALAR
jgi:hypothetical protein